MPQTDGMSGGSGAPPPLTLEELAPLLEEAVARWTGLSGTGPTVLNLSGAFRVEIGALPLPIVGVTSGNVIIISADASGRGWFVDPTPWLDEEFVPAHGHDDELTALPGSPAAGRVDLLTVLLHELGHIQGLGHTHDHGLMGETLPAGVRRLIDAHDHEESETAEIFQDLTSSVVPASGPSTNGDSPILPTPLSRRARNRARVSRLGVLKVLAWAAAYHERTGRWPARLSGPVAGSLGDTWAEVAEALQHGHRGLKGKTPLHRMLRTSFYRLLKRSQ